MDSINSLLKATLSKRFVSQKCLHGKKGYRGNILGPSHLRKEYEEKYGIPKPLIEAKPSFTDFDIEEGMATIMSTGMKLTMME